MVSIGPNSQSYNFTHMFDMGDLRKLTVPTYPENTIMGFLDKTPEFSIFNYIVKLAKMDGIFSCMQANFTLFVPTDESLQHIDRSVFLNMDVSLARHFVKTAMLDNKITFDLLVSSGASYFTTKETGARLFVVNKSGIIYINNHITIKTPDIILHNGIIHITNDIIWPTTI